MNKKTVKKDYGDYNNHITYKVINMLKIFLVYMISFSIIKASIVYYLSIPAIMNESPCGSGGNTFMHSIYVLNSNGFYGAILLVLGLYVVYKIVNKMVNQYRLMYVMGSLYEIKNKELRFEYGVNRFIKLSNILSNEDIIYDLIRDKNNKVLVNRLNENNFYLIAPMLLDAERVKNLTEDEFKLVTNNFEDLTYIDKYNKIVNNVLKAKLKYKFEIKEEKNRLEQLENLSKQVKEEQYKNTAINEYLNSIKK